VKDALGRPQTMFVIGGGSDIALATVRAFARRGLRRVVIAARDPETAAARARALAPGVEVEAVAFQAEDVDHHEALVGSAFDRLGDVDLVLLTFGVLPDQDRAMADREIALHAVRVNYLGAVSVLLPVARRLRGQGHGDIVVLSSVAAERGRRSNFVYGSTKAGLDTFCQGLGDDLHGSGVGLLIVRPGFVRSKMTRGLSAVPLSTDPPGVAAAIADGLHRGADVVWVPAAIRPVISALRHLPRAIFRRLEI
jgi:decaprenylphospho-beta-D-erythro-pentofuranosid-2-ulose 2-reductase